MARRVSTSPRHVPALDGVRGLAIALVVVHHFTPFVPGSTIMGALNRIAHLGWCGVDLFFVLSGFLITGILLDSKTSPTYFRHFYMRRILRIAPLYYFVLLVAACVLPFSSLEGGRWLQERQAWFWIYASNILMTIENRALPESEWINLSHFWSLAIEEQFYLVWPAVVYSLPRRRLLWFCLALVLLVPLARLAFVMAGWGGKAVYVFTPLRVDALAIGALLAVWLREGSPLSGLVRYALGSAGALLALIIGWRHGMRPYDPVIQTAGYSLIALLATGLLLAALRQNRYSILFSVPALRWLGRYSYGLYVYHGLLRPLYAKMLPAFQGWLGSGVLGAAAYFTVSSGASILVAWASYELFEARAMRLKERFPY